MPDPLPLRRITAFDTPGQMVVAASINPAGRALLLCTDGEGDPTFIEDDGRIRKRELTLKGASIAHPHIQTLPYGEVLVVDSRAARLADGTIERNARVFGSDGSLVRAFSLGDGIEHVRVDTGGDVWVGYFDEGIYGDDPTAAPGLIRFDAYGQHLWNYRPPKPELAIDDCYALTVEQDQIWTYFYSPFAIVRISDGHVTAWPTKITGAKALAVAGDRVLIVGGYRTNADRALLARLVGDIVIVEQEYRLDIKPTRMLGVGGILHVFSDDHTWYQADVAALT